MNSPVNVMGLPSFQSECTLAPKKYSLAVAGFTRASHTSALDASIAMDALDTCFLSILSHSPCLTHNDPGAHPRALARNNATSCSQRYGERSSGAASSYPARDAGNRPLPPAGNLTEGLTKLRLPDESIQMVMAGKQASDAVPRRFANVREVVVCVYRELSLHVIEKQPLAQVLVLE